MMKNIFNLLNTRSNTPTHNSRSNTSTPNLFNSRSNTPIIPIKSAYSPVSITESLKQLEILVRAEPLYSLNTEGELTKQKERERGWTIQRKGDMNYFPEGLYDFVIVQNDKAQETRVLKTTHDAPYQHHILIDSMENVIYAGRMEFREVGVMHSWNNEHSDDLGITCVSAEETELPTPENHMTSIMDFGK